FFNLATLYKRLNRRADAATAIERYCEIEERKVESSNEEKISQLKALREEVSKLNHID
ncbi:MAG: hypothetical protein GYA55_08875, partial [SAR324 cluster bacterium]|nr:hypothetical protein [SAR324 cluster bacterium]